MNNSPPEIRAETLLDKTILARNPPFLTCDDAAACLHGLKFEPNTEVLWYILKNHHGQYFCAEFVDTNAAKSGKNEQGASAQETPLSVSEGRMGRLRAPTGYSVEASFHLHPPLKQGVTEPGAEFRYRRWFFSCTDLWNVMNRNRQYSRCYLSAGENGLISYTSKASEFEGELARQIAKKPDGKSQLFQRLYEGGVIPASVWILLAIGAGEVAMVVNSGIAGALWSRRGSLQAGWKWNVVPGNQIKNAPVQLMPICGPVVQNVTKVAAYLRMKQQDWPSTAQAVGIVLKHLLRDEFLVTAASASDYASFDRAVLFPKDVHGNPLLPEGFREHGFYHSIKPTNPDRLPPQDFELYKNFYSPADLKVGLERLVAAPRHHLFLITPDGAVLKFSRAEVLAQTLIAELEQDFEQSMISGATTPRMFVDKVAAAGDLSVLLPSLTWPIVGKVWPSTATDSGNTELAE